MKLSLTDKQKSTPYRNVRNSNFGRLTVIERSFAEHRWKEIAFWDSGGILEDAMLNHPTPFKDYSESLMGYLVKGLDKDRTSGSTRAAYMKRFDDTAHRLWELGASRHTESHAAWLQAAPPPRFINTLLDHNTNPHEKPGKFYNHPLEKLFERMVSYQVGLDLYSSSILSPQIVSPSQAMEMERVIDRCLDVPGASSDQLDLYLGAVAAGAFRNNLPGDRLLPWVKWREQLIKKGAHACFSSKGGALNAVISAPQTLSEWCVREHLEETHQKQNLPAPTNNQVYKAQRELSEKHTEFWQAEVIKWLDELLPTFKLKEENPGQLSNEVPSGSLARILHLPKGLEIIQKLMTTQAVMPWSEAAQLKQSAWPDPIIISSKYSGRAPDNLSALVALTKNKVLSDAWVDKEAKEYLKQINIDSQSKNVAHIKNPWSCVATPRELDDLLRLSRWIPGKELPKWCTEWLKLLPPQWEYTQTNEEERVLLLDHLYKRGVLKQLVSLKTARQECSFDDMYYFSEWAGKSWWTPQYMEKLLGYNDTRSRLSTLWVMDGINRSDQNKKSRIEIVHKHDPNPLDHTLSVLLNGIAGGKNEFHEGLQAASHMLDLGVAMSPSNKKLLVNAIIQRVNDAWSENDQNHILDVMQKVGCDFGNVKIVDALCFREKRMKSSSANPHQAGLVPMVRRLVDLGDHPSSEHMEDMEDMEEDGPLATAARLEMEAFHMRHNTARPKSSMSRRRL